MILQSDPWLRENSKLTFEASGCALLAIVEKAVIKGRYNFKHESFLDTCRKLYEEDIIDDECTVLGWNSVLKYIGMGDYEIVIEDETHLLHRSILPGEFQLLRLYNPETGFRHFVGADQFDNVTYDSLGESKTVEAYRNGRAMIASRRIFRKRR